MVPGIIYGKKMNQMFKQNKIMKTMKFNLVFLLWPIASVLACKRDSTNVSVKTELYAKYEISNLDFSQFVANNDEEYKSFLYLIKNDSCSTLIANNFKPDFTKFSYVFSCEVISSIKYNPEDEVKNKCYNWYNKKYHILLFDKKETNEKKSLIIYKIEKTDKGYKEDCG